MARHWEVIWTFNTANFQIEYAVSDDDDFDMSWDEDGSVTDGLNRGLYVAFVARMRVIYKDTDTVLGQDYLGQCIYESATGFIDRPGTAGYFRDMVHEACREARSCYARLATMPKLRKCLGQWVKATP